ncbi:cohesin subunit SA-3-like, partial [Geospiza fortis]|uniref:Cohesin subunit SA n=1 Tax=Geospiza fortis TaxID=48883 RepID=A0A8N5F4U1_GEOFO
MFRELQNSEIIRRLTETFQEDSPEYPFSQSSHPWRRFRAGFCELLALLVSRGQHRELQDGFLMDCAYGYIYIHIYIHIYIYISIFQDSPEYPFSQSSHPWRRFRAGFCELLALLVSRGQHRELQDGFLMDCAYGYIYIHIYIHIYIYISIFQDSPEYPFSQTLKLMSSLVEVALAVGQQQENCQRQFGAEKGKEPGRSGSPRLEALRDRQLQLREQQEELELLMNGIFKGVFVHRDVVPEIRALCMEELGLWVRRFPGSFLTDSHLKYLGWTLHDKVLRLLTDMDRNLEEALSPEDCQSIFPVVFVSSRALASAAGRFLYQ